MLPTRWTANTLALAVGLAIVSRSSDAQTAFSFRFGSQGSVQSSIANQSCSSGSTGMMGGGTCSEPFTQELTQINGVDYYHVILGHGGGEFGMEYFIRTSGSGCWYGCTGARVASGMGGMGGGPAPLSASSGNQNNYADPLNKANSGVGRPDQTAIFMFNRTTEMSQEFLKAVESRKPKITQQVNGNGITLNFALDMSAIGYSTNNTPGKLTLAEAVTAAGIPAQQKNPITGALLPDSRNFDVSKVGPSAQPAITGGRYTYTPGSGDGGSRGTYAYFADHFDPYNVNWAQYCDPNQNPTSDCTNFGGLSGGMMGGTSTSSGGGGMGGGM